MKYKITEKQKQKKDKINKNSPKVVEKIKKKIIIANIVIVENMCRVLSTKINLSQLNCYTLSFFVILYFSL